MSAPSPAKPRGSRVACSLRTSDGANGIFSVYPGTESKTLDHKDEIKWDKTPTGPVVQGVFTIIGEMGMTGQVIVVKQEQWKALADAKLEKFFFGAILWDKSPFKVIEDAQLILKRGK